MCVTLGVMNGEIERESESMTFFTDEYIMERKLISIGPVQILRLLCNATEKYANSRVLYVIPLMRIGFFFVFFFHSLL